MSKLNQDKVVKMSIRSDDFGFQQHKYNQWSARVPGDIKKETLENPDFWALVSRSLNVDDEIRILAEDYSFIAHGIVTHKQGSVIKFKLYQYSVMEAVDQEMDSRVPKGYHIKMRGPKKWCIGRELPDNQGIEWLIEGISVQSQAYRELEEHLRALAS